MSGLTIRQLVLQAERFAQEEQEADLERTPFAEVPWTAASHVMWTEGDDTTPIVVGERAYEYFLEPAIIEEVKEGLDIADPEALIERVIQYARDDA